MLNSVQNGKFSFIITALLVYTTTSSISTKNPFLDFTHFFTSLFHSYSFPKSSLQFPLKLSSTIPSNFSPPCFCVQLSQQSTPKILSLPYPFSQFRLREGTRKLGSLMRTDTVLISIFFLKVCTVITGLTTTDPYRPGSENWCIAGSNL